MTASIGHSKITYSSKSTYVSWICYFDEGEGSQSGLVLEALLPYWSSWFIPSSGGRIA